MIKKSSLLCGSAFVLAIAACSDSTGIPANLSQAELNKLASDMDAVATLTASDFGGAAFSVSVDPTAQAAVSAPVTFNHDFTVSKACPKGGTVTVAGNGSGTGDATTHSLNVHVVATRADNKCAFETEHGVLTVTGEPNVAYDGKLNIVNAAFSGLQTQTHIGKFFWERAGASQHCDVNLASSFDPATHTVRVTGTFCGANIDVTRSRLN